MPVPADRRFILGLLKGEGVGPEVIDATIEVLGAFEGVMPVGFELREGGPIGYAAQREHGQSLTPEVVDFCREVFDVGGAVMCGPGGGRFVYDLRACFDLYCKLIPLRPFSALSGAGPLRPCKTANVDIIIVRENTGGLYFGEWGTQNADGDAAAAFQHCTYREHEVERILEVAFNLARQRRGQLAMVTKPGGVPAISELWDTVLERMRGCGDVQTRTIEIDNAVYQLIARAHDFDVVVCSNMFGDVLGDCGGLLLGSRGMSYSANFGPQGRAVYQTGHGAAWDLAGSNRANPLGQIGALAMMLRESCRKPKAAALLERAVNRTLARGVRTPDIATADSKQVGTREMGQLIRDAVRELIASEST